MAIGDYIKTYNGDGVTTDFAIPFPYDNAATEVVVTRANGAVTYSFLTASLIRLTSPTVLAIGDVLTISRLTNIDTPVVVYKNGSTSTGGQLNSMVTQLLRAIQEIKDFTINQIQFVSGIYDAGLKRISNLGAPAANNDAVRLIDLQNAVTVAGNVPVPVLAQVGRYLKATATGVFAWTALVAADISDATTAGKALLTAASVAAQRALLGVAGSNLIYDNGSLSGFRNRIINADFRIDQRGNYGSSALTAGAPLGFFCDRWYVYCTGGNASVQVVPLASGQYGRAKFTGAAGVTGVGMGQRVENLNCADLAGGVASLSCKLSSTSLTSVGWALYYANTTNVFGTLASPTRTLISSGTFSGVTSTEAVFTALNISIPAAAVTGLELVLTGGALLAAQTLSIGEVQLEKGAVATPFEFRSLSAEIVLCQRYYEKMLNALTMGFNAASTGGYANTIIHFWKVRKRIAPTVTANIGSLINVASNVVQVNDPDALGWQFVATAAGNVTWTWQPAGDAEL